MFAFAAISETCKAMPSYHLLSCAADRKERGKNLHNFCVFFLRIVSIFLSFKLE